MKHPLKIWYDWFKVYGNTFSDFIGATRAATINLFTYHYDGYQPVMKRLMAS